MKKILFIFMIAFLSLMGCQKANDDRDNEQLYIYTSVYTLQFVIEALLDDEAKVMSVYPPGVDAHTYEPSARDITSIAKADVFFYVGGHMEGFTDTIAETLADYPVEQYALIDQKDIFLTDDHGELDPHIWLDPSRMIEVTDWAKSILLELRPELKDHIDSNYHMLIEQFTELDDKMYLLSDKYDEKPLLVVHDAYQYWAKRYGIKQISIHGMMAGEESSQKKLAHITRLAEQYDIHYIIFEQNNDDQVAHVLLDYLHAKKVIIHDLEVLTDQDVRNQEDYLSIMDKNIDTLEMIFNEGTEN